jgi:hypothetical protein
MQTKDHTHRTRKGKKRNDLPQMPSYCRGTGPRFRGENLYHLFRKKLLECGQAFKRENLEGCKETLGEEILKLNRHVEDYWRNKLFNLNSKDKNKFEGY